MDKRGLIGKIFGVIGIIILIILLIAGITAYQAYSLIQTAKQEQANIETASAAMQKGDCSALSTMEASFNKIFAKGESACMNPIIRIAVQKMEQIPLKCENLTVMKAAIRDNMNLAHTACGNSSASNSPANPPSHSTPPMPPGP